MEYDPLAPDVGTLQETVMSHHLLGAYLALPREFQLTMFPVFINTGLRAVLASRSRSLEESLMNIVEESPRLFQQKYMLIRNELALIQDLLTFLDQGKAHIREISPELVSTDSTQNEGT